MKDFKSLSKKKNYTFDVLKLFPFLVYSLVYSNHSWSQAENESKLCDKYIEEATERTETAHKERLIKLIVVSDDEALSKNNIGVVSERLIELQKEGISINTSWAAQFDKEELEKKKAQEEEDAKLAKILSEQLNLENEEDQINLQNLQQDAIFVQNLLQEEEKREAEKKREWEEFQLQELRYQEAERERYLKRELAKKEDLLKKEAEELKKKEWELFQEQEKIYQEMERKRYQMRKNNEK